VKLLNFLADGQAHFGLAVDGYAVPFTALQAHERTSFPELESIYTYLESLPESFEHASMLADRVPGLIELGDTQGMYPIIGVRILPPIPKPAALLDFALTPRHLVNSMRTMLRHEFGSLASRLVSSLLEKRMYRMSSSPTPPYYKGNHLSVIGDHDEIGWPSYTSYPDIEPELAILTGRPGHKIAGYMIFNDASARDVQFPEMFGSGPARSKDFSKGNGLGPFLVTPDEIPDPLSLNVIARVGERFVWKGSTLEYAVRPERVVDYFEGIFTLVPGVVLGMGTIPGCTGLDNDQWIEPGEIVEIMFEGLGTLHQKVPTVPAGLEKSRWEQRF
jgi:2-keto-4-pentenoate hydratase/2-oxohepta-3-ene-1,7-dioic acid hydratase in catechol pathway